MVGDQLLIGIANRLSRCVRPGDKVARLGGDEFTILLDDIRSASEAVEVADRIQKHVSQPFNVGGYETFTTVSIGIAFSNPDYQLPEDFLRDADTAMYLAKAHGKARFEFFNPQMRDRALARMNLETDLRRATQRKEFVVYYQPIVSLDSGGVVGFEALLRWQHPDRGLVAPAEFITVAEETNMIVSIGGWALREACRQMSVWRACFPAHPSFIICVNLSSKQFLQVDLTKQIDEILSETHLQGKDLKLEITESLLMEDVDSAANTLSQLKELGVQVAIDDFGTGYCSLNYLHKFPIDTLKIDRSFVSQIRPSGENSELVRTMVTLGQNLGLDVIAEGVETKHQLIQLRKIGCKYGQGYYFSEPLDSEAATALVASVPRWISDKLEVSFS